MAHRSRATSLRRALQSAAGSRALSMPFASSCRAVARWRVTFFIGRCRSTRTLSLKDRRDGLRIQRTHRRASTPKVRRKKARPQLRYRPLMPSWRMGRSTRLRTDFAPQADGATHDKGAEILCGFEREAALVLLG